MTSLETWCIADYLPFAYNGPVTWLQTANQEAFGQLILLQKGSKPVAKFGLLPVALIFGYDP